MEDIEVIDLVLGGDRNAYAILVRKYESRVRGFCARMLSDAHLADDAAQEVFVKAYRALEKFKRESSFSTWLYRIASNHCFDLLRKRQRRKTESWDALVEKKGEQAEQALLAAGAQDRGSSSLAQAEQIEKMLQSLSDKHREIITLREVQGLSYDELADALQCSLNAVKSRLKRARQEMEEKARHFLAAQRV